MTINYVISGINEERVQFTVKYKYKLLYIIFIKYNTQNKIILL